MTITVWPVDAVSGAPSYTGRMLRQAANGLWTPNGARPLGARTGVVAGTSTGIVTASATTWTCGVHRGVLDLEANAIEGPYGYSVDAAASGAITAADSTYSRIDIVYVQLSDPAAGDGTTTPQAQVLYFAGTPAASPAVPATPARSMVLAQITVPKAGGGAPSVTFVAPFTTALGGIVPASSSQRPTSPYVGQFIDDPVAGALRYDGSGWQSPRDRGPLTTADCNTLTAPGVYRIGLNTPNAPSTYTTDLIVEPMQQGAVIRQLAITETTPNVAFTRTYVTGSGWTAWYPIGEVWQGGESPLFGAAPGAGQGKIRRAGNVSYTTNTFGQFAITLGSAFPNGIVSAIVTPWDTGGVVSATLAMAASSLTTIVGVVRNSAGAIITSTAVRISWAIEGW